MVFILLLSALERWLDVYFHHPVATLFILHYQDRELMKIGVDLQQTYMYTLFVRYSWDF